MNTITLLDRAATIKLIGSIGSRANKLQDDIHRAACSTLAHVRDHSDWTLAASLLQALPNGQRVKALMAWYAHFSGGKLTFNRQQDGAYKGTLAKDRAPEDFDIEGACKTSFADLTAEKDVSTMTAKAVVKYLTRIVDNADAKHPNGQPKYDAEAVALAAALLAKEEAAVAA